MCRTSFDRRYQGAGPFLKPVMLCMTMSGQIRYHGPIRAVPERTTRAIANCPSPNITTEAPQGCRTSRVRNARICSATIGQSAPNQTIWL
jgi:hypothetical protein